MKLLIVDDSAMIRRSINEAYEGSVFTEIQTAADGLLAVTVFKALMPDVVTMDITMPHMDGLAAMSKMLEIKPDCIVLVVSALADHHTAIDALVRGANQFICKPFTADELKEALELLLEEDAKRVSAAKKERVKKVEPQSSFTDRQERKHAMPVVKKMEPDIKKPSVFDYPSGYVETPKVKGKDITS